MPRHFGVNLPTVRGRVKICCTKQRIAQERNFSEWSWFGPTHACTEGQLRLVHSRYSGPMPFTVVHDACVLYPATLRDVLIRDGQDGLVHVC